MDSLHGCAGAGLALQKHLQSAAGVHMKQQHCTSPLKSSSEPLLVVTRPPNLSVIYLPICFYSLVFAKAEAAQGRSPFIRASASLDRDL